MAFVSMKQFVSLESSTAISAGAISSWLNKIMSPF